LEESCLQQREQKNRQFVDFNLNDHDRL